MGSSENKNNDGDSSPENIVHMRSAEGRREGIDRRLWTSGELLGTCAIWYEGFQLWHLITGVMGLRVEGICGEDRRWRTQDHILWPDNQ